MPKQKCLRKLHRLLLPAWGRTDKPDNGSKPSDSQNKVHELKFPPCNNTPEKKKQVDYLYIDADEDHVALQFQEKKGDIEKAENGIKNNGLLTKLVYVYEGKEKENPKSNRRVLVNPHYFCRVNQGEDNLAFWDEIYNYLEQNYDLEHVKKIYLNSDGGSWIKAEMKRIRWITYVCWTDSIWKNISQSWFRIRNRKTEKQLYYKYRTTVLF